MWCLHPRGLALFSFISYYHYRFLKCHAVYSPARLVFRNESLNSPYFFSESLDTWGYNLLNGTASCSIISCWLLCFGHMLGNWLKDLVSIGLRICFWHKTSSCSAQVGYRIANKVIFNIVMHLSYFVCETSDYMLVPLIHEVFRDLDGC
jgi:hypothetical protein